MYAGKLRERVTIQSPATTRNAAGEYVPGWAPVVTVWAALADISGREYIASGATQNSAQTIITIRYRNGIQPNMRVLHGQIAYNIEAVLGQDRVRLQLMCKRLT